MQACGSTVERNECYPIGLNGLIVQVANTTSCLPYYLHVEERRNVDLSEASKCYKSRIEGAFHNSNIMFMLNRKLRTKNVKCFVRDMEQEVGNCKPDFLMVFFTSAGINFGQYLLEGTSAERCKECFNEENQEENHLYDDQCCVRRVADFIRSIQTADSGLFAGIPKIFVMQTVTGMDVSGPLGGEDDKTKEKLKSDQYIPRGSDTWILYAHTTQSEEWIKSGFYVLDKYLDAVKGCMSAIEKKQKYLAELNSLTSGKEKDNHLLSQFQRDCIDVRFDNFCMIVTTNVAGFLEEKKNSEPPYADYTAMRLHTSSTLRKVIYMSQLLNLGHFNGSN